MLKLHEGHVIGKWSGMSCLQMHRRSAVSTCPAVTLEHAALPTMQELVVEKMPKLAEHFSNLQCDITIVATDWFLCLFCTTLPSEVSVHMVYCEAEMLDIQLQIKLAYC